MTIWLVEDNYLLGSDICKGLQEAFPARVVKQINTEHEFYRRVDEIALDKDGVLVLDIMLRWCLPSPDMPKRPDRVRKEGVYRAGFRCLDKLAEKGPPAIPVILCSVLDEDDIKSDVERIPSGYKSITFLAKNNDTTSTSNLVRMIMGQSATSSS